MREDERDMIEQVMAGGQQLKERLVAFRRDMHQYPELGFEERESAGKVAAWLTSLGLTVRTGIGGHGVVADLKGGLPGPMIALRADMDALPISEKTGLPYSSQHAGVMHACGHDVHTSILLGAATLLVRRREQLAGSVRFIFQSAEELLAGASRMIEEGVLEGVTEIYGLHNSPYLPAGQAGAKPGVSFAAVDRIEITVEGKGGHGSKPEHCVDPIVAASAIVMGLQTVVSRELSPMEPAVVTIGSIRAGMANNVIPSSADLTGTVRTFAASVRDGMEERIRRLTEHIASGYRCGAHVNYIRQAPVLVNDEACTHRLNGWLERILGSDNRVETEPSMGGEDFAYYLRKVPGCYFWLGSGFQENDGEVYGLHSPHFVVNEECIPLGASVLAACMLLRLGKERAI